MLTDREILENYFPAEKPRTGQLEVIKQIINAFDNGKRYVIFEGPVGCGKSIIAKTIANIYAAITQRTCYITSQVMLQEQLIKDFGKGGPMATKGPHMVHLKGRSNYQCVYPEIAEITNQERALLRSKNMTCSTGPCKRAGKSMCKECVSDPNLIIKQMANPDFDPSALEDFLIQQLNKDESGVLTAKTLSENLCPYWNKVGNFMTAQVGLMNFKSFLFQCAFSIYFKNYHTDLLVIDECHNAEREILDFVGIVIDERQLIESLNIKLPSYSTVLEYAEWFAETDIVSKLFAETAIARVQERMKDAEESDNLAEKIKYFLSANKNEWVLKLDKTGRTKKLELKPIFIKNEANLWLFNRADKILLMSATILSADVMCQSLGISKNEVEFIKLPNSFPVENRPIYFTPAGSMSYNAKDKTLPKLLECVEDVTLIHDNHRGIIHTHNFSIAEYILLNASDDLKSRLLFQKNFKNKEEMLQIHSQTPNSIIIAPAMHEGLDLVGDLSRFQIICKVPYPNFKEDPQLEARMKIDNSYYDWLTGLKLVQSYGRSIRSNIDWADTYILDMDFSKFLQKAGYLLPEWFKEAIK